MRAAPPCLGPGLHKEWGEKGTGAAAFISLCFPLWMPCDSCSHPTFTSSCHDRWYHLKSEAKHKIAIIIRQSMTVWGSTTWQEGPGVPQSLGAHVPSNLKRPVGPTSQRLHCFPRSYPEDQPFSAPAFRAFESQSLAVV